MTIFSSKTITGMASVNGARIGALFFYGGLFGGLTGASVLVATGIIGLTFGAGVSDALSSVLILFLFIAWMVGAVVGWVCTLGSLIAVRIGEIFLSSPMVRERYILTASGAAIAVWVLGFINVPSLMLSENVLGAFIFWAVIPGAAACAGVLMLRRRNRVWLRDDEQVAVNSR